MVLRGCINIGTDARNSAIGCFDARDSKVRNLHRLAIRGEQKILWLDVTMNHATRVRVREAGANLLQILQRPFER